MPKWKIKKKMDKAPTGAKRPTSGPYSKEAVEKKAEWARKLKGNSPMKKMDSGIYKMKPGSKETHSDDSFRLDSPLKKFGTPNMSPIKNTGEKKGPKDVTYTESKTVNTGSKFEARRKANAEARRKKLGIRS